jgi:hypothetical protein
MNVYAARTGSAQVLMLCSALLHRSPSRRINVCYPWCLLIAKSLHPGRLGLSDIPSRSAALETKESGQ